MERNTRFDMITNQMMKGCSGRNIKNNVAGTDEEIQQFKALYGDTIRYIESVLPKSVSVGVCGALGKALLWYGKEKMCPFVEAVGKKEYKGVNDPCHVLWEWLIRNGFRNTKGAYRRTVTAVRFYIRGVGMSNRNFPPAGEDIFEWVGGFEPQHMMPPKRNQPKKTRMRKKKAVQTDAEILAEIESTLGQIPE